MHSPLWALSVALLLATAHGGACGSGTPSLPIPPTVQGTFTGPFKAFSFTGTVVFKIAATSWVSTPTLSGGISIPVGPFTQTVCNVTNRFSPSLGQNVTEVWHTTTASSNPLAGQKPVQCLTFARLSPTVLRTFQTEASQACPTEPNLPASTSGGVTVVTFAAEGQANGGGGSGVLAPLAAAFLAVLLAALVQG